MKQSAVSFFSHSECSWYLMFSNLQYQYVRTKIIKTQFALKILIRTMVTQLFGLWAWQSTAVIKRKIGFVKKGNWTSEAEIRGKKIVNWLQGKWLIILDSKYVEFFRQIEAKSALIQGLFWISPQLAAWTLCCFPAIFSEPLTIQITQPFYEYWRWVRFYIPLLLHPIIWKHIYRYLKIIDNIFSRLQQCLKRSVTT